jgi:hypothetical protein
VIHHNLRSCCRSRDDVRQSDQAHLQAAAAQPLARDHALQSPRHDPNLEATPRTVFFAGKAAPAYHFAKLIIKLINNVGDTINNDPAVRDRLKVFFLPEYNVSLAERLMGRRRPVWGSMKRARWPAVARSGCSAD